MALKPTTVRFVPGEARSPDEHAIAALHLWAYRHAVTFVQPGTRVLDVGFGEGYGSEIIASAGGRYEGLEVDGAMVLHARERYPGSFHQYDGRRLPVDDASVDLALSFQVLAYLEDPIPWLEEIRRVTRRDGYAILTTPNRVYRLDDGQRPWNRYHAREYKAQELEMLLARVFPRVDVLGLFAEEPIDSIVRARAARARSLAKLDPLGLRYRLPEAVNARVRRLVRRAGAPDLDPSEFGLDRIRLDGANLDGALDLVAYVSL